MRAQPVRLVHTIAELDALTTADMVRSRHGRVYRRSFDGRWCTSDRGVVYRLSSAQIALPATVLIPLPRNRRHR